MKIEQIRTIARAKGIVPVNIYKTDLIKMIQIKEGNFDCYATATIGVCDQENCCWRQDCFETARKGEPS